MAASASKLQRTVRTPRPASFYRKLSHCIQSLLWTPVHSLLPWADTHAGWSHQLRDEQPRPPLQAQRMSHLLDFIPRHILRFPWVPPPKRCQGPQDTVAHPGLFVCLFVSPMTKAFSQQPSTPHLDMATSFCLRYLMCPKVASP